MKIEKFKVEESSSFKLKDIKTDDTDGLDSKKDAKEALEENILKMAELQARLYAQDKYSMLIIFQAMDTAGKDGGIKHVMSGLNPQATQVTSFKQPSKEELDHDYLWRANKHLPERGRIGIFNRSYYEEVLVVKVHDLLKSQQLPASLIKDNVWEKRFRQIRDYEKYLTENGTVILKFFLHISKEEQKQRLLERIDDPSKNWKFSSADIEERKFWDDYQKCYQEAIRETTTDGAPWYVIPSDKKWFARLAISEVIVKTMENLKLEYPVISDEQKKELEKCKKSLMNE